MNRDNCFCSRCDRRLNVAGRDCSARRIDIYEDRFRANIANRPCSSYKGHPDRNHFITWPDVETAQRKMERARSKLLDDSAMLFIETLLQRSFTVRVQGKQVEVIVRSPVQHASTEIYGGIDERVGGAAIFRLDVIRRVACFHVRIVTEEHSCIRPGLRGD